MLIGGTLKRLFEFRKIRSLLSYNTISVFEKGYINFAPISREFCTYTLDWQKIVSFTKIVNRSTKDIITRLS